MKAIRSFIAVAAAVGINSLSFATGPSILPVYRAVSISFFSVGAGTSAVGKERIEKFVADSISDLKVYSNLPAPISFEGEFTICAEFYNPKKNLELIRLAKTLAQEGNHVGIKMVGSCQER